MQKGSASEELRRLRLEALGRRLFERVTGRLPPWLRELIMFALKEGWACLFGGAMVTLIILTKLLWPDEAPLSRYDGLFLQPCSFRSCSSTFAWRPGAKLSSF